MKSLMLMCLMFLTTTLVHAQENLSYQKPPKEILDLVDIQQAPRVLMDSDSKYALFLYSNAYKSLAELSEKEMRLGGLRINPKTNIGSRVSYFNNITYKKITDKEEKQIEGLPKDARLTNFLWSSDQSKMAFTNTTTTGVEVWFLDLESGKAKRIMEGKANANMGRTLSWFGDGQSLLVKCLPNDKQPLIDGATAIPNGPTISVSEGSKAQNRTYQDLLKNNNDEHNFEQLAHSELYQVNLKGEKKRWLDKAMYLGVSFSPDNEYVMITTLHRPFSYIVPYYRFPQKTTIYDKNGKMVRVVNEVPLTEELPKGFMSVRKGKRSMQWRSDQAATLVWVEALDEGDPAKEVEHRDELFQVSAPFNGTPASLFKTKNRFYRVEWGTEDMAIVNDYWWNTRKMSAYLFNPSNPKAKAVTLIDRNYQDRYSDPGSFVSKKNKFGRYVLDIQQGNAFLIGDGYTKEGQFPFIDQLNLKTQKKKRLYQSAYTDKLENIYRPTDLKNGQFLVRIESPNEYPNYYIRNIKKDNDLTQITAFENPFKSIQNVHKEVITYKRKDGLELSGTLYLPVGYDKKKKEKMPMLLWAYPREYKDKNSASQKTSNPNAFTYPYYGSFLYWVTRGYVVLDNAAFPIVGEGDEEPNDSFREQLVSNAEAAIDAVDKLGYIDRNRVAVGGHSYGAFMTANLLSHTKLFAAGIARSGAYNRTLTPFGFQSEERSYWEAPKIYNSMSPFMHAEKMKTPLLLIHGEADNNSGTYPLQSERYFNALKGLGAITRLVMLPKESHGYRAKESILHLLWEQDQWLEKYVKNRAPEESN